MHIKHENPTPGLIPENFFHKQTMSLCIICLPQLLKHTYAYISFQITGRRHAMQTVVSFAFTNQSPSFLSWIIYVGSISINVVHMAPRCTMQSKCPFSSLTGSWALSPGSLHLDQLSSVHYCYSIIYLTSLPSDKVIDLTSSVCTKHSASC